MPRGRTIPLMKWKFSGRRCHVRTASIPALHQKEKTACRNLFNSRRNSQHAIVVDKTLSQWLTNVAPIKLLARVKEALGSIRTRGLGHSHKSDVPDLEDE
jgi:hypothetical protein